MVQKSKKRNIFLITSIVIIVFGLICFVLAYGLSLGWYELAIALGSKWAIILYICLGCYIIFAIWLLVFDKIKRMD